MKKAIIGLASVSLAFTLFLSACGDKDTNKGSTTSGTRTSTVRASDTSDGMLNAEDGKITDTSSGKDEGLIGDIVTDASDMVSKAVTDVSDAVSEGMTDVSKALS